LEEKIGEGYLGNLLAVSLQSMGPGFMDADGPMHWRNDRDLSGYNILNMGIWYEAMIRWVGRATRVMAMTQINVSQRRDEQGNPVPVTIPDHVDILANLSNGAQANLRFSAVAGLSPGNEFWLYGSEGTIRVDSGLNVFGGRRGESQLSEIPNPEKNQATWRVEEEFCNAIRGQEKVTRTPFDVGVHYMEFTEAVTRSAQLGEAVSLPL
jgi:predicted dehydrogenase